MQFKNDAAKVCEHPYFHRPSPLFCQAGRNSEKVHVSLLYSIMFCTWINSEIKIIYFNKRAPIDDDAWRTKGQTEIEASVLK